MSKYTMSGIGDLLWYADKAEGTNCNITIHLRTPAGQVAVTFDPHEYDIKNMTINELEALAIKIFEERLKG